jgi:hypothetical protein
MMGAGASRSRAQMRVEKQRQSLRLCSGRCALDEERRGAGRGVAGMR